MAPEVIRNEPCSEKVGDCYYSEDGKRMQVEFADYGLGRVPNTLPRVHFPTISWKLGRFMPQINVNWIFIQLSRVQLNF